jgi:2-dehydro-3-deoxyphosphogluconate aldolase/(4S)-4-hydroxy-2-oxoglutarate aldolase
MPSPEAKNVLKKIRQSGIVPVFYHEDPEICKNVLKACYEGGIRVFQFTNEGARAQETYLMLKKYVQSYLPEMYVGIGGIKDAQTAEVFINYNADFVVCSTIDPAVGDICRDRKVLWIPGCYTPTEIALAERTGATLLQLLPGEMLGAGFVKAVRPMFPAMQFIPMGGVEPSASSIIPWLEAGVTAVFMGDKMITPETLALNNYSYLKDHVKKLLKTIRQWRQQSIA